MRGRHGRMPSCPTARAAGCGRWQPHHHHHHHHPITGSGATRRVDAQGHEWRRRCAEKIRRRSESPSVSGRRGGIRPRREWGLTPPAFGSAPPVEKENRAPALFSRTVCTVWMFPQGNCDPDESKHTTAKLNCTATRQRQKSAYRNSGRVLSWAGIKDCGGRESVGEGHLPPLSVLMPAPPRARAQPPATTSATSQLLCRQHSRSTQH